MAAKRFCFDNCRQALENGRMLLRFHIVLVSTGIIFCLGYGLYELIRRRESALEGGILPLFFFVAAAGLWIYLRRVLRYGLRARPRD